MSSRSYRNQMPPMVTPASKTAPSGLYGDSSHLVAKAFSSAPTGRRMNLISPDSEPRNPFPDIEGDFETEDTLSGDKIHGSTKRYAEDFEENERMQRPRIQHRPAPVPQLKPRQQYPVSSNMTTILGKVNSTPPPSSDETAPEKVPRNAGVRQEWAKQERATLQDEVAACVAAAAGLPDEVEEVDEDFSRIDMEPQRLNEPELNCHQLKASMSCQPPDRFPQKRDTNDDMQQQTKLHALIAPNKTRTSSSSSVLDQCIADLQNENSGAAGEQDQHEAQKPSNAAAKSLSLGSSAQEICHRLVRVQQEIFSIASKILEDFGHEITQQ